MSQKRQLIDQTNMRIQKRALYLGLVLFGLKLTAYILTNSNAILTDALEGLVNIFGAGFGLFSLWYAVLPRDKNHPYGHGKIEFLSAGFEGSLILIAGGGMIVKSIYSFFVPIEVSINELALVLVTIAGVVNYLMGISMVKQGEKENSIQLIAGGKHLISDGYTTAGLLVGLAVVWLTGLTFLDSVLAILLGGVIAYAGIKIIRKSIAGVMDEADLEQIERVAKVLNDHRRKEWVDIHNFRIVRYGSKIHLDAHLTLPWYYTLKTSHDEVDLLEKLLDESFELDVEASIHTEPCLPSSCSICLLDSCGERKSKFVRRINWDVDHILDDNHHEI